MVIWFQKTGMQILLWLLGIVDSIFDVFKVTAGLTPAVGEQSLGEYIMSQPVVVHMFMIVLLASVFICGVCTVVGIIKGVAAANGEGKSPARTLAQASSTLLISLAMGAILISGITVADGLLKQVDRAMNGDNTTIMSHEIINVSVSGLTVEYDTENILGLNVYENDEAVYISPLYCFIVDGSDKSDPKPELFPGYEDYAGVKPVVYCNREYKPFNEKDLYDINHAEKTIAFETKSENGEKVGMALLVQVESNAGYYTNYRTREPFGKDDIRDDIWKESVKHLFGEYKSTMGFPTEWIEPAPTSGEANWRKTLSVFKNLIFCNSASDLTDGEYWKNATADTPGIIRPDSFNFVVAYLTTIIMAVTLIGASLGLVKRVFDIVFLFITLPGIAATIPLDDGAKFKLWRETVISKLFLAYGTVLAVNIFFLVAPSLWTLGNGVIEGVNLTVLRVFLVCGGALSVSGGQLLMSRLLGTSAEESREMSQSARTLMAGAMTGMGMTRGAGRAVFGTKNAYGQRVGGLIKGTAGAFGAVAGGAANVIGGALSGQAYKAGRVGRFVGRTQQALRGFSQGAGWFGTDRMSGGSTLGGKIGSMLGNGADKFAGSSAAQKTGLDRGVVGGVRKLGQTVRSHASMEYSTKLDKENQATERAKDIAAAFGVSPYAVKHVKERKQKE